MEGQNGYENPLELMLLNLGGRVNHLSYGAGDDPNQHFITADGSSENMTSPLPLPQLFQCQRTPQNYYEFLTENSSIIEKTPTHVLESIPPPVSDSHFIQGMTESQTEFIYNNPGLACGSKPADSSPDMDAWKLNPHPYIFNTSNNEASFNGRCLKPYNEGDPAIKFKSSHHQSQSQSHTSWEREPREVIGNVSQSRPRAKVAASVFLSNTGYNVSRQRTADRQRRERIAERLKALQQLVPQCVEGSQTAVVDEIIDYVKYLQLQMKELSRSRLGGELRSDPSIFLEGYHHYIVHEQTMNQPLEKTMARLLEVNSSAATKFLESKGLLVMPMALTDSLQEAI